MPSNLLLLPLIAGWLFLRQSVYFRYTTETLDGQRLIVKSSAFGLIFLILGRAAVMALRWAFPASATYWHAFLPIDYSGTAAASLLLSVVSLFLNYNFAAFRQPGLGSIFRRSFWKVFLDRRKKSLLHEVRTIRKQKNALLRLLEEVHSSNKQIAITLSNRKFYIGYIGLSPSLDPDDQFLTIYPIASGYRDKDDLRFRFTTSYLDDQGQPLPDPLSIVIPLRDIQTANIFNPDLYARYFADNAPAEAEALDD